MTNAPPFELPAGWWADPVTVRYTAMDVAEAFAIPLRARLAGWRRRRWVRVAFVLICVLMLADATLEWRNWGVGSVPVLFLVAMLALGRVPTPLLLPFALLEMRQTKTWQADTVVRIGEAGVYARAGGATGVTLWPEVAAWGEGGRVLALQKFGIGSLVVPKRAMLGTQLDAVRAALTDAPRWGEAPARKAPPPPPAAAEPAVGRPRTIVFTLVPDEVIAANRSAAIRRLREPGMLRLTVVFALGSGLLGWAGPLDDPARSGPVALAIGVGAAILTLAVIPWLIAPWLGRRAFRLQRTFQLPTTLCWSDSQVDAISATGALHRPWPAYRRWRETGGFVTLHSTANWFQIIPKRAMSDDQLADLRQCARLAKVPGA